MWTQQQLVDACRSLGLSAGDLVLVHSALRRLGPVEGGADGVIDALLDVLGPEGTLAMPTHTWKVVHAGQPVFHQALTPSNVGVLTNVFRQRPGVIRSLHPTHSLAAIGPRAAALLDGHERDTTPCPPNGPYGRLSDWNAKILLIGVDLNACTLFHCCEERAAFPGGVTERPTALYSITTVGRVIPVPLRVHCINTWDQYPRLAPALEARGCLRLGALGACPLRLLDARAASDWVTARLQEDPSVVLRPIPADGPEPLP